MGKLAERFGDAGRSGLYRVRDAKVPRLAALEAHACLVEVAGDALANGGWASLRESIEARGAAPCVLLVMDGGVLADPAHSGLLEALLAMARSRRESGPALFAVLVDPEERLALPLLYRECVAV